MKLVLVDHCVSPVDPAALAKIALAVFNQLREVAAKWSEGFWTGLQPPESVTIRPAGQALADDEYEIGIFDKSDQPGAGGYHATDPRGAPYGKAFMDAVDGILQGQFPLSVVLSHEAVELFLDVIAALFAARIDGATLDAVEGSDAVQGTDYQDPDGLGVTLANYLLPAAFDAGAQGPYDRQGALKNQYDTTPAGYRIKLIATVAPDGTAAFRCEAHYGPEHSMAKTGEPLHEARKRAYAHPSSHASRRGVEEWKPAA